MLSNCSRHAFDKKGGPIIFDFEGDCEDLSLVKGTPVFLKKYEITFCLALFMALGVGVFHFYLDCFFLKKMLVIKKATANESFVKQVSCKKLFLNVVAQHLWGKLALKNYCKSIHFSSVASLVPAALLKNELFHKCFF